MEPYFLGVQHMKPEEKARKVEEEREEAKEREKKPYSKPELTKYGPVEEMTDSPMYV
jgi:hypothetical protein